MWRNPQMQLTPTVDQNDVQFHVMEKYPTENYILKFFGFDSGAGCFVSLYWDGDRDHARKF